jgi:F0F1-type ATP synthase delta subunit
MKYTTSLVARAFAKAIIETPQAKHTVLQTRFKELVTRHGLGRLERKILDETERILMRHEGKRDVLVETPRTLTVTNRETIQKKFRDNDRLHFKTLPELIAGIKIIVDGDHILDNTLKRKLEKLFR